MINCQEKKAPWSSPLSAEDIVYQCHYYNHRVTKEIIFTLVPRKLVYDGK